MSSVMRFIRIKDLSRLRQVLESPNMFNVYRRYVPYEVTRAEVMMYRHDGGVEIDGKTGRWWLFIRLYYGNDYIYDLALWKLGDYLKKLAEEGILEIRTPSA